MGWLVATYWFVVRYPIFSSRKILVFLLHVKLNLNNFNTFCVIFVLHHKWLKRRDWLAVENAMYDPDRTYIHS